MTVALILFALIIFTCILLNNLSSKIGLPVLLLFIIFGLLAGLGFDNTVEEYGKAVGDICTVALIFVMFYGGFGTRWTTARPVVVEAGLLASLGVILTAAGTGLFCHFVLGWKLVESFLMGSVICSTDAATVFSILRTKHLGLKSGLAPVLEIESGSNDPCSYMLTAIFISIMKGTATGGMVVWTVFAQLFFGALFGILIAQAGAYVLRRYHFKFSGFDTLFMFAIAILSYALPSAVGGNGYLSTYIVGIVLGNVDFRGRKPMIPFFDGITDLMQIVIFFLLGFMADPRDLLGVIPTALLIFLFLMLVARPAAVFSVLAPFRKYSAKMMGFVSFVGLRGAASIVFAIMAVTGGFAMEHNIFNIVFVIVLLSIACQGSLIPMAARKFDVIDPHANNLKTFSEFTDHDELVFGKIKIKEGSTWLDKTIAEVGLPGDILIVGVERAGKKYTPTKKFTIRKGDLLIISTRAYTATSEGSVRSYPIEKGSKYIGQDIRAFAKDKSVLVIMISRQKDFLIPDRDTEIRQGDVLMTMKREPAKLPEAAAVEPAK